MLPKIILLFVLTTSVFEGGELFTYPDEVADELLLVGPVDYYGDDQVTKVVGGVPALPGEFPFQVSLRLIRNGRHNCGGSIITRRHILTAAHCFLKVQDYYIYGGSVLLSTGGVSYSVDSYTIHEDYVNGPPSFNDIAIITLTEDIQLSEFMDIVTLSTSPTPPGSMAVLTGWGSIAQDGHTDTDELMKLTDYPIIDLEECMSYTPYNNSHYHEGKICAQGTPGHGSCNGDSGGPLSYEGTLIGLDSYSREVCAIGFPDVYTNVYYYLDWIIANTGSYSRELRFV